MKPKNIKELKIQGECITGKNKVSMTTPLTGATPFGKHKLVSTIELISLIKDRIKELEDRQLNYHDFMLKKIKTRNLLESDLERVIKEDGAIKELKRLLGE